jgi:hypothetical protein
MRAIMFRSQLFNLLSMPTRLADGLGLRDALSYLFRKNKPQKWFPRSLSFKQVIMAQYKGFS